VVFILGDKCPPEIAAKWKAIKAKGALDVICMLLNPVSKYSCSWFKFINPNRLIASVEVDVPATKNDGFSLRSLLAVVKTGHALRCWPVCVLRGNTPGLADSS
jgi:hypothetical protein